MLLFQSVSVISQVDEIMFYRIIQNDSVHLYFNDSYEFVEEKCADFIRETRIDAKGEFSGYFIDKDTNGNIISKGRYIDGEKHGRFIFYYSNNAIQSRGVYRHNIQIGAWEYFYEDGSIESVWEFDGTQVLLKTKYDNKGNVIIKDGNGEFNGKGFRGYLSKIQYDVIGTIKNGKRDGKWKVWVGDRNIYCEEEFKDGKFIEGILVHTASTNNKYFDQTEINIWKPDYLSLLEVFKTYKCPKVTITTDSKNYTFNNYDLRSEIDSAIKRRVHYEGDLGLPTYGEHVMTIQFSIREDGKPKDFKMVSPWGRNFYRSLRGVLGARTYPPIATELFFHLKISFSGGPSYSFSYKITKDINGF